MYRTTLFLIPAAGAGLAANQINKFFPLSAEENAEESTAQSCAAVFDNVLYKLSTQHNIGMLPVATCSSNPTGQAVKAPPKPYVEKVMGFEFPPTITLESKQWSYPEGADFIATAPKCLRNMCWLPPLRAYSIGLYINRSYLESRGADIRKNPQAILEAKITKFFRLVFNSGSQNSHIAKGFENALKLSYPKDKSGEADVDKFIALLKSVHFDKGSVLLVCLVEEPPPGKLILFYGKDGNSKLNYMGQVDGEGLRIAFHNLYLKNIADGTDAVYPFVSDKLIENMKSNTV